MKEVTMIITAEMTSVVKVSDEDTVIIEAHKYSIEQCVINRIKSELNADDAKVLNNQLFIRDVPDV